MGRRWDCAKSWDPFGLPADRETLTTPVSSVTGGCEKQHWCLLLQLPNSSQRAFRRGWQNGWVLLGLWSASLSQTVLAAPSWLQLSHGWGSHGLGHDLHASASQQPELICSGLVACPYCPATPIVTRTQVFCSSSLCQTRGGCVFFWSWFLGLGFFFFEGLGHSNGSRIWPHTTFTVIYVFLLTFIKLLFELAGKLLEKQFSLT